MKSPVRAVFFDAGFTLIFPTRPIVDLYVEAARAVSADHRDDDLRAAFDDAWRHGTRDVRDDHRSSDELERNRWALFTHRIATAVPALLPHHGAWLARLRTWFDGKSGWALAPGAEQLLARLRRSGRTVGIVSNWHGGLRGLLEELGVDRMVDFIVCSAEVGVRKPHPRIFEEALRTCDADPGSAVHVGDTYSEDVVGALSAGIRAVHLAPRDQMRPGETHRTIEALGDLEAMI